MFAAEEIVCEPVSEPRAPTSSPGQPLPRVCRLVANRVAILPDVRIWRLSYSPVPLRHALFQALAETVAEAPADDRGWFTANRLLARALEKAIITSGQEDIGA